MQPGFTFLITGNGLTFQKNKKCSPPLLTFSFSACTTDEMIEAVQSTVGPNISL